MKKIFLTYIVSVGVTGEPHFLLCYGNTAVPHNMTSDDVVLAGGFFLGFGLDNQLQNCREMVSA